MPPSPPPAALAQPSPDEVRLSGSWTACCLGGAAAQLDAVGVPPRRELAVDGGGLAAVDSVGAWVLQRWIRRLRSEGVEPRLVGWPAAERQLVDFALQHEAVSPAAPPRVAWMASFGERAAEGLKQGVALLAFIGECAAAFAVLARHPRRWRWRTVVRNLQTAGYEALPIIGLMSLLLGVVVAYQGADQLRNYGANVFVVELVGYSMLREFAPLITAIIVAGRSGSAYAAEIGTMVVTEEVDALRTLGIEPREILVVPKVLALVVALPMLTVWADLTGVIGGMIMARSHLGVGFFEFVDRFGATIPLSTLVIGVGKSVLFAIIIAVVGTFQGFRTRGDAASVGRQTTFAVVQAIFLVIVCDAALSVAFTVLDL